MTPPEGTQHDPLLVRREYASRHRLARRAAIYEGPMAQGRDAKDVVFELALAARPTRILEVGCGDGSFAQRLRERTGAGEVIASDQSAHMVSLAARHGLTSVQADVAALPFRSGGFDLVVANWMLYHVADLPAALAEIRRVLGHGGRLLAATKSADHLREVWDLVGHPGFAELSFRADTAPALLAEHFSTVRPTWVTGSVVFPDISAVRDYIEASMLWAAAAARLPAVAGPIRARREVVVFECVV